MENEKIIRILVPIAILFIMGVYLLKQKIMLFQKPLVEINMTIKKYQLYSDWLALELLFLVSLHY